MKKILQLSRVVTAALFLLFAQLLFSQVTVNLNVLPPYSPYFKDYAGFGDNKVIVTLHYNGAIGAAPINVYLAGSITKDDGSIKVAVKEDFRPTLPITLMPNVPKTLTGAQLREVFGNASPNALTFTGITKDALMLNQAFPEGNYNFCIKAMNYQTGQLFSEDCRSLFIVYAEPPQITPFINNEEKAKTPQYVNVNWSPVTPFLQGTSYRLRIVKLIEGLSPYDALNYSAQVVLEKSSLMVTNFPLDLASGVKLEVGATYVAQVVATAPTSYIKNNGRSEPVVFKYTSDAINPTVDDKIAQFTFFNPRELKKADTIRVNAENNMLLNWGWIKGMSEAHKDTVMPFDLEQIKLLNLNSYKLTVRRAFDNDVLLEKSFEKDNVSGIIKNYLGVPKSDTEKAGFTDGEKYFATIDAYDDGKNLYKSFTSNQFVYKIIEDDSTFNVKVQAVINYDFKGFPEIYPVQNTEVTIEAYVEKREQNTVLSAKGEMGTYVDMLPSVEFDSKNYVKVASHTSLTNDYGSLNDTVKVPKTYYNSGSISYRLKIGNRYFVDSHFPIKSVVNAKRDSIVEFGNQIAHTYAYQLKLNVTKRFGVYQMTKDAGGLTVKLTDTDANKEFISTYSSDAESGTKQYSFVVKGSEPIAGLPVVLYRENKKKNIPFYEGDISKGDSPTSGTIKKITVVALGVTRLEGKKTVAVFDKLLATNFADEEYKILAINNLEEWLESQKNKNPVLPATDPMGKTLDVKKTGAVSPTIGQIDNSKSSGGIQLGGLKIADVAVLESVIGDMTSYTGGGHTNFADDNKFVAEVMPFKLDLPKKKTLEDQYYRTVEADYTIVSAKPPTSVFKGRLAYEWASEKGVKRPLAKTHFRVMVDYVDKDNRSIGNVRITDPSLKDFMYSDVSYLPDNSETEVVPLIDQYATMGEGVTDENGNFEIETVNYNFKGNLGAGTLVYSSGSSEIPVATESHEDKLKGKMSGEEVINPWESGKKNFGDNFSNSVGNAGNLKTQGSINGGYNVEFDAGLGSFELGKSLAGASKGNAVGTKALMSQNMFEDSRSGPNPEQASPASAAANSSESKSIPHTKFSRVFRIVIDGNTAGYYYPSKETIEIQPFECNLTPKEITHYVREFHLVLSVKEKKPEDGSLLSLPGMQTTIFKDIKPNQTSLKLPEGEGDGKYTFAELLNPEYSMFTGAASDTKSIAANDIFSKKFEHIWSKAEGSSAGVFTLKKLLQGQLSKYFIESSSFVDRGTKAYQATVADIPAESFDITDISWVDPKAPVIKSTIVLKPLVSRALITVRDVGSNKPITSDYAGRVIVSNTQLPFSWPGVGEAVNVPVDKYGKAEIRVSLKPYYSWFKTESSEVNFYFFATANGYTPSSPGVKSGLYKVGTQFAKDIGLTPGNIITGKVITNEFKQSGNAVGNNAEASPAAPSASMKTTQTVLTKNAVKQNASSTKSTPATGTKLQNGLNLTTQIQLLNQPVGAYLQVDSGQIFETNADGSFDINVPIVKNSKLRIIPKDVGYFSDTIILTEADSKKSTLAMGNVEVFRRRHRIQMVVKSKYNPTSMVPSLPISGAKVQLGEKIVTTDASGIARFEFENVSVNNYTFIVRGAPGSGLIPKSVNLKSEETKYDVQKTVELEAGSEVSGIVKLDGVPVKNAKVYIDVSNASTNLSYSFNNTLELAPIGAKSSSSVPGTKSLQNTSKGDGVIIASGDKAIDMLNSSSDAAKGAITDDANLVVTFTDKDGKYTLRGVPVDNQQINIRATLDTAFTVSGDKQPADIKQGKATANLNLKGYKDMVLNKIYGFPLTVENITPVNSSQVKVTGLVHWTEALSDFKLKEFAKSVRIEETLFDLVEQSGVKVGVAHNDEVSLTGINTLKLSFMDKYNVQLINAAAKSLFDTQPLKLKRDNDYGKISGKMKIVDNSFNYPNTYLSFDKSEFYFATLNESNAINNVIDVLSSVKSESESKNEGYYQLGDYQIAISAVLSTFIKDTGKYKLCDVNAQPIKFKLIRFDADADPLKSYIDQTGKIHLNTNVECHIPNAQPEDFSFNIPDMVLDENKVYPANGSDPLKLKLENWTLEVKDWTFSVEEGGILSTNSMIRTKLLDVPVNKFVLRSDMFIMSDFQLKNLTLAGGKFKMNIAPGVEPKLNYEYKVGADMKPHWNLCMLSNGPNKVGSLQAVAGLKEDGLTSDYIIDFDYVQILSNDDMLVQLKQKTLKANLLGNTLARFEPLSIMAGDEFISISGQLFTGAPRMSGISLNANWDSPTKNPSFENVTTDFEGKGYVHFIASKDKITISKDLISIVGKVKEVPVKSFNPVPATFYAHTNGSPKYEVVMQKDWVTQLTEAEPENSTSPISSSTGYNLKITEGGMQVIGNDWSTCKFSGIMNTNGDAKENVKDCLSTFEVLGDVSVSSDNVRVADIDTPFGSMSQTFDLANKRLIGTLKIKSELALGTLVLHNGTIETCFDPGGFYVAGGCYAYIPAGLLAGDYNIGFMMGVYKLTPHLWDVTNSYIEPAVQNLCYKAKTTNLTGIYTAFNREVLDVSHDFDYIIASGYVKAKALIGGDFYVNVESKNKWKIGADGFVHIDVGAGLSAITGTSISGRLLGDGIIAFQFGNPNYFSAGIALDFTAHLKQSLVLTTISKDIHVGCSASAGTGGFSFNLSSGGASLGCP